MSQDLMSMIYFNCGCVLVAQDCIARPFTKPLCWEKGLVSNLYTDLYQMDNIPVWPMKSL